MRGLVLLISALGGSLSAFAPSSVAQPLVYLRDIDPSIVQEMRYCGDHNFVGRSIRGYETDECLLTERAARALKRVQEKLSKQGLSLKVYDCYRPVRAVMDFVQWAKRPGEETTKGEFYPEIDKSQLFALKYISSRSAHSRGSTVDLTVVSKREQPIPQNPQPGYSRGQPLQACHLPVGQRFPDNSLDFGTGYDCFHALSHTDNPKIVGQARGHRRLLVAEMEREGFRNYPREWWHFTLKNEPFPGTHFDSPIRPHKDRPEARCTPKR
ncbi:MAG: M15 family metallopeptidase [Hyphomicrobiaceae bacterium]